MDDDVTLLPCPFCGSYDVRTVHGTDDRTILVSCGKCHALVQEWGDKAITLWNTRIPNPRVAALEAELAEARAWNSTLADTADALRAELGRARKALAASGIGGIYDVFQDVADAIEQMALYIKERDRHVTELEDELVRLRPLAEANARVAAQTPGRPITRAEALAISHATLENAEAERAASDDGPIPLESDTTRESFLSSLRLVRDADNNVSLCGPDGDHVIAVRGNLGLGLSAHQIGLWVADACYQASRTCATCRFCERLDGKWCCVAMSHELSFYVEPQSDYCSTWQANVERASDMPSVDDGSTNSDAAMWRVDHASAIRYIESLHDELARLRSLLQTVEWLPVGFGLSHAADNLWLVWDSRGGEDVDETCGPTPIAALNKLAELLADKDEAS